jgi:hypothetical protein
VRAGGASTAAAQKISKLRTMLNSCETADLACEIVIAADEAAVCEQLLEGCQIVDGRIKPNHTFRANQEWRTRALLRIVAYAPETAAISRKNVVSLAIASDRVGDSGTASQINAVRDSVFTSLPDELGRFTRLEALSLHDTLVEDLPDSIGELSQLRELVVSYQHPRYFDRLIGERCPLRRIPETISSLQKLETLDLSGNSIRALPEAIGGLKALKVLRLAGCPLTALPESIGKLANLEDLDLSGCPLEGLPESLGQLKRLRSMVLKGWNWGDSTLAVLPESLGDLASLEELDLSGTEVTTIPAAAGRLQRLKKLSLPGSITSLPLELGLLSLDELQLKNDYGGKVLSGIVLDLCRRAYAKQAAQD